MSMCLLMITHINLFTQYQSDITVIKLTGKRKSCVLFHVFVPNTKQMLEKPEEESGMDNPETQTTFDSRHRTKKNKSKAQQRKLKR